LPGQFINLSPKQPAKILRLRKLGSDPMSCFAIANLIPLTDTELGAQSRPASFLVNASGPEQASYP